MADFSLHFAVVESLDRFGAAPLLSDQKNVEKTDHYRILNNNKKSLINGTPIALMAGT
jgi:hypothetical protein